MTTIPLTDDEFHQNDARVRAVQVITSTLTTVRSALANHPTDAVYANALASVVSLVSTLERDHPSLMVRSNVVAGGARVRGSVEAALRGLPMALAVQGLDVALSELLAYTKSEYMKSQTDWPHIAVNPSTGLPTAVIEQIERGSGAKRYLGTMRGSWDYNAQADNFFEFPIWPSDNQPSPTPPVTQAEVDYTLELQTLVQAVRIVEHDLTLKQRQYEHLGKHADAMWQKWQDIVNHNIAISSVLKSGEQTARDEFEAARRDAWIVFDAIKAGYESIRDRNDRIVFLVNAINLLRDARGERHLPSDLGNVRLP